MADGTQTFTTRIILNDEQAKTKIAELEKRISIIRSDMVKAADAGDWSKFNSLKKDLNQATRELSTMRTTAQSVNHVLNSSRGLTHSCNVQACIINQGFFTLFAFRNQCYRKSSSEKCPALKPENVRSVEIQRLRTL
jgi:hypothetical protein